jgi:hypothetical protein
MCARALQDVLDKLRELAPPKKEDDDIERARKRRDERLAGQSASGSSTSS